MSNPIGPRESWRHPGARALVLLHERHMRTFLGSWAVAHAADLVLPGGTSTPQLLDHVVRWSGYYVTTICEWLGLPDPGVPAVPPEATLVADPAAALEALLAAWREPLREMEPTQANGVGGKVSWGVRFTVDSLLEHAVMHPQRHALQLEEALSAR